MRGAMTAFGHSTAFFLGAALLISCAAAAPASGTEEDTEQTQALDLPNDAGENRCYYNFQHYEEGDRIVTNEPCLNCTCHKRMLMCYLRVCPFTKAVGQDCTVEKRPDQCCPVITCPQVPVDILTSSTTTEASTATAVGHLSNYGCTLEDNTFYPDGVQMPSDPKKPCELCYCIRNHTACVRQECTLNVEGCQPVYQEGVCCPVRYDCDYNEITTTERPSTGGLLLSSTASPLQCRFGDILYNDGELIESDKPCESCYCMRGDIVCAVRSCGEPMAGKDCEAIPPPEGQCCPTEYKCANGTIPIGALETESSTMSHSSDLQTQLPAKESESSTEVVSKPDEPIAEPEVATSAPSEEEKQPEKVENDKPEADVISTVPEGVESDPLDADELEDEEALHEISQSSDMKPPTADTTGSPLVSGENVETSSPVKESDNQLAESSTASHLPEESETSKPSGAEQIQITADSQDVPLENEKPEHVEEQDHIKEAEPVQVEEHVPSNTEDETKEHESQPTLPYESPETSTAVSDSDSEASDNTETKPVENVPDEVSTIQPINEIQPEKVDSVPETLDQVKIPESNIENDGENSVGADNVEEVNSESDSQTPVEQNKVEGEASAETTEPPTHLENESVPKEPVPPRKDDATPEEPHPTQHAEGSATKAEDSIPADDIQSGVEIPEKTEEVENNSDVEIQNESNVKPTQSLDTEASVPSKEEDVVNENASIQTEQPVKSEVPLIDTPQESSDASPETTGDEKENDATTEEVKPQESFESEGGQSISEGEVVPSIIVTESESEFSTEKVPEESSSNESNPEKTPVTESPQNENVEEDSPSVELQDPILDNSPQESVNPSSSNEINLQPVEESSNAVSEADNVSENANSPSSDDTELTNDESSTKENEISEKPNEEPTPIKEESISQAEEVAPSTDKVESLLVPEQDSAGTHENEISSEQTDANTDEKVPEKETQTEKIESEESSTDSLTKLGSETKPEFEDGLKEGTTQPAESKPAESISEEQENLPSSQNTETNEFEDVDHGPVELDVPDFEGQEFEEAEHIHDGVSSENEIVDDHQPAHGGAIDHKPPAIVPGPVGIPGEGDCLVDGITYSNNSEIPSKSACHKVCTCMSSIVHCQGIDCPPPPPQLANCMPVHQADMCCPVYTCDGNTNESPESDTWVITGSAIENSPSDGESSDGKDHPELETESPSATQVEEEAPSGAAVANVDEESSGSQETLPESNKPTENEEDIKETSAASENVTPSSQDVPDQANSGNTNTAEHQVEDVPEQASSSDSLPADHQPEDVPSQTSSDDSQPIDEHPEDVHIQTSSDDVHPVEHQPENIDQPKPSEDDLAVESNTLLPQEAETTEKQAEVNPDLSSNTPTLIENSAQSGESLEDNNGHALTTDSPSVQDLSPKPEETHVPENGVASNEEEQPQPGAELDSTEEVVPTAADESQNDNENSSENSNDNQPPGTNVQAPSESENVLVSGTDVAVEGNNSESETSVNEAEVAEGTDKPAQATDGNSEVSTEKPLQEVIVQDEHEPSVPEQVNETNVGEVSEEVVSATGNPNAESDDANELVIEDDQEHVQLPETDGSPTSTGTEHNKDETATIPNIEIESTPEEPNHEGLPLIDNETAHSSESPKEEVDVKISENEEFHTTQTILTESQKQEDDHSETIHGDNESSISESESETSHATESTEKEVVEEQHIPESPDNVSESESESTQVPEIPSSEITHDDHVAEDVETVHELHTESSESEHSPSTDSPIVENGLSTKNPEGDHESISTEGYSEKHPEIESDDLTSEVEEVKPAIEHQETIQDSNVPPEETETTVDESTEQLTHTVEQEQVPHEMETPSETENPNVESEHGLHELEPAHHPEPQQPESLQPEHETEKTSQDVTSTPLGDVTNENVEPAVPGTEIEGSVKPEETEPVEEEHQTHDEITSAPAHEDIKPTDEESHQEVESTASVGEPASEIEPVHHHVESSTHNEEESLKPEHHNPEQQPDGGEEEVPESILSNVADGTEDELKPNTPIDPDSPSEEQFPTSPDMDYDMNEDGAFGPGTCRYGGKVYVSAQQIPRDDPCDFCFCFRSDIICLQQSCPPPIHRCHQEPIQGYCCPRYQCPVSMATTLNLTTTTTTTTTTLPPHFFAHAYQGAALQAGCLHRGQAYKVGEEITSASGPCLKCMCGSDGQMKCEPVVCSPEPMLRKMMEAAISHRRR